MELNSAEEQVSEICILYKRLMQTDCKIELPPINVSLNNAEENKLLGLSIPSDPKFVMSAFEKMQTTLCELETKMTRFQSRSREVDPVTGNPRYGPSTLKRVLAFLGRYQEVNTCVLAVFGDSKDAEERTSSSTSVIDFVRQQVREQEEIERQMKQAELEQFEREAAAKKADEERATEERRRRECEIEQQAERKRQELAREYEQVRLNQQIAREAAEQRDKEWLAGIKHGAEGVREQLDILIECTAADPVAPGRVQRDRHAQPQRRLRVGRVGSPGGRHRHRSWRQFERHRGYV
jgi:flagellar biosynthesis GTPase FlhF